MAIAAWLANDSSIDRSLIAEVACRRPSIDVEHPEDSRRRITAIAALQIPQVGILHAGEVRESQRYAHDGPQMQPDDALLGAEVLVLGDVGEDLRLAIAEDGPHDALAVLGRQGVAGEVALGGDLERLGLASHQHHAALALGEGDHCVHDLLEHVVQAQRRVQRFAYLQ